MEKIKKDYTLKIICIGISVVLFFNLPAFSYSFSGATLRIPLSFKSQQERIEAALYLQEHFLFKDEEELKTMIDSYSLKDLAKNMARESDHFLYRAMRLETKALLNIPLRGLLVSRSGYGKIYFVVSPFFAAEAAFFPISTKNNYPMKNFMCVAIQVDRAKVPHLTSREDILPEAILKIFVFDKTKQTFVDKTGFFNSLARSELSMPVRIENLDLNNIVGDTSVSIETVKESEYARYADILHAIAIEEAPMAKGGTRNFFFQIANKLDFAEERSQQNDILKLLVAKDEKDNVLGARIMFKPEYEPKLGIEVVRGFDIVREKYKRQGIGTKLRKAAFAYMSKKGYEAYEAFIVKGDAASLNNLKKLCEGLNLRLEDVTDLLVSKIQQIGKKYLIRLNDKKNLLNIENPILLHYDTVERSL